MKDKEYLIEDQIKLFVFSNQLLENDLDRIENEYGIDLGRGYLSVIEKDQEYYPQIDQVFRAEASKMAKHYEVFYSLEKSIRGLIAEALEAARPGSWWDSGMIPQKIKSDAEARMQKDVDTGFTPRSPEPLDFTNFGELGEIIKANRDIFGSIFPSQKAVERVLKSLNTLRGPIAHCSPLAEDEIVRLRLSVKDWFRLME